VDNPLVVATCVEAWVVKDVFIPFSFDTDLVVSVCVANVASVAAVVVSSTIRTDLSHLLKLTVLESRSWIPK